MPLILQLSDLHLGTPEIHETLGDHKVPVVPVVERLGRSALIKSSLRELGEWLRSTSQSLDAIVIAGDVTYQLNVDGYALLEPMLNALGSSKPDPTKILIVPGNHDVKRGTQPSTPERYEAFVAGVDIGKYVRPYLEGVDIDRQGMLTPGSTAPIVVDTDGAFVIVGVNSANYCQIQLPTPDSVQAAIANLSKKKSKELEILIEDWGSRGHFDVARIGGLQRQWASHALREAAMTPGPVADNPNLIRIAAFHHQLLPVSLDEEAKPFDALVNLAEVRDWIAANEIDLLLHGHKHTPKIYDDRYLPEHEQHPRERRVLVSSTATVGLGQGRSGEVGKLIRVEVDRPTLRRVSIASVPARDHGIPLRELDWSTTDLANTVVPSAPILIQGTSTREVHEQLLASFEGNDLSGRVLVCHVSDGSSAAAIPASFPVISESPMTAEDFSELVEIWQSKKPLTSMRFNHGERISSFHEVDQLDTAARALGGNPNSSRAVMMLLDPARDELWNSEMDAPSFCLVQLVLNRGRLDVVGYFRKQEMRFWWPVNAAELYLLQSEAVKRIRALGVSAATGSITTITGVAAAGQSMPRVAIPRIDRDAQRKPERILEMSLAVFGQPENNKADLLGYWRELLSDCTPPAEEAADGTPAATEGLQQLCETLDVMAKVYGSSELQRELSATLKTIRYCNREYLTTRRDGDSEAFANWAKGLEPALADLTREVAQIEERLT